MTADNERRGRALQWATDHPDTYFHDYGDGSWKLFADDGHTLDWSNGPDEPPAGDGTHEMHAVVPHCRHGHILLGCDDDTCPEQNAYLAIQRAAMTAYDEQMRSNARAAIGLPRDPGGAR